MRSPTASTVALRSFRRALVSLALITPAGCTSRVREQPPAKVVRLGNVRPLIEAVLVEANGKRVRAPRTGVAMTVHVHASDRDGDTLSYAFTATPDGAAVRPGPRGTAEWRPGAGAEAKLRIRVVDPKGAADERVLVARAEGRLEFGGTVSDPDGKAIAGAVASVDGVEARTDAAGRFRLSVPDTGQGKFIVSVTHAQFGMVSAISTEPLTNGRWTMSRATIKAVDLTQPVVAAVTSGSCARIPSSTIAWAGFPKQRQVVRTVNGMPTMAVVSPEVAAAIAWAEAPTSCPSGFTVRLRANSMVRAGGGPAPASAQVALTQIPAWGGGSMPGDNSVRRANGSVESMRSYGAATVRVSVGGEELQLARGQRATLEWPVQSMILPKGAEPPKEIPLLRYDRRAGEWNEAGMARLDSSRTRWTAEVDHFSELNLDLLKVDAACVQIDATMIGDASFELEALVPQAGYAAVNSMIVDNDPDKFHLIRRLPLNTDIVVRAYRTVLGTRTPIGTWVVNTMGSQTAATEPPPPPYDDCQGKLTLTDVWTPQAVVAEDNVTTTGGNLVPLYLALVDPTDPSGVLPMGAVETAVLGIYDPGSTSVNIETLTPNQFSGAATSDAVALGVANEQQVSARISPLDWGSRYGPTGLQGTVNASHLETATLQVEVGSTPARDLTRIGAPFVMSRVAWIDYTIGVPFGASMMGAWSRFPDGSDPSMNPPIPKVQFVITPFGATASAPISTAPRISLAGVTFFDKSHSVGYAIPGWTKPIVYDPGSVWTAISDVTADALQLVVGGPADSIGVCNSTGRRFKIDRVEIVQGMQSFVVNHATVCRHQASMLPVNAATSEAVLGANLFRNVQVIVDGPGLKLGIYTP